jgi:hypothetical protein
VKGPPPARRDLYQEQCLIQRRIAALREAEPVSAPVEQREAQQTAILLRAQQHRVYLLELPRQAAVELGVAREGELRQPTLLDAGRKPRVDGAPPAVHGADVLAHRHHAQPAHHTEVVDETAHTELASA